MLRIKELLAAAERSIPKPQKAPGLTRCKYCGARLRTDPVGKYCPTRNCQWQHGVSTPKP